MKLFVIGAALPATFAAAVPASAQSIVVREGGDRVVVREHRDNGWHRGHGWRHARAECRVVKVKKRLPNGTVVIRTHRSC